MQYRKKIFYGWYIVGACVVITLYTGGVVHFGFTAVFEPIAEEFNWSYAQVSLASSLRGLEMGLLAPFMGFLVDRYGPRRLILVGSILSCLGFLTLSRVNSLPVFYLAFALLAFGMSTCAGTVLMTAVANWFNRKAGIAIGIVACGFGLGGLLVPVVTGLIDWLDWRNAMVVVGLGMLVFVLPLSFVVRHKPEQYGYHPDGELIQPTDIMDFRDTQPISEISISAKEAIRGRTFWQLGISSMCHAFVVGAVVTHIMPYLSSLDIDRSLSSIVALILPVVSIGGRLSSGWLGIRYGSRRVFAFSFVSMTAGLLFLGNISAGMLWLLVPFIITFSLGWGCSVTSRLGLLRESFGRDSFGKILGFISGMMMLGHVTGAPLAGWVYDNWGSYQGAWLSYGAITLLAAFLVFTIPYTAHADTIEYRAIPD
jgi:sugar phosphate permease